MKYLNNLDLGKNQLLNAVLQNLATDPSNPVEGLFYYNTGTHSLMYYNGTAWKNASTMTPAEVLAALLTVDGSGSGLDADKLDNQDGAYYLDRSKHTGTQVASTITTDALSRFVSDSQIANWDAKETPGGAQSKATTAENNAKAYADTKLAALLDSAPATLDTLNELAAALGDDPNFATTIMNAVAGKTSKYSVSIGNGSLTSITVTHNLNTTDVVVSLKEVASPYNAVITDWKTTDANNIVLTFATAPTANQYRCVVIG